MSENNGVYNFINYLDKLNEMSNIFKSVTTATEIMSELPLTEEQIIASNLFIEGVQKEWQQSFLELLKVGVEWLEYQEEVKE